MGIFLFSLPFYYAVKLKGKRPIVNALSIGTIVILLLLLLKGSGYNHVETFLHTRSFINSIIYTSKINVMQSGITTFNGFIFWQISPNLAFLIYLGIPLGYYLLNIAGQKRIFGEKSDVKVFEILIFIIYIILNVNIAGPVEYERIWLFLVPFLVVPITKIIIEKVKETQYSGVLYTVLVLTFFQTWVFQLVLNTKW